ncbi:MAG: hypothetical protein FD189_2029 [Elusimicrobia bacterium]|nr:MAG: hypothetical protein FD154_2107 [Elusimicrobiota bacterium]KAF0154215.1 MAG: hypothetical protein FD189_2029 [Elusimicrobiota bacterium]
MKKILIAAVLLGFAGAAKAEEIKVDFDGNSKGVSTLIEQASGVSADLPVADRYIGHSRYTRDCVRFGFGPSDAAQTSERVWLRSQEYIQDCHTQYVQQCHTVMVPGPNGTQVPQQQCSMRPVTQCYERPGQSWREAVQVKVEPRKLFPWERDSVEVCLEGPWSRLYVNQAAYKYSVSRTGNYDTLYTLTPGKKVAMDPDKNGLEAVEFSYEKGKYTFKVSDKWAKEYAGEKVAIKVDLYREVTFWPDSSRGEKEFVFDAANGYEMTFTEKDLQKAAASDDYRGPKKFYLKWGFKRLGEISTDKFVKMEKTGSVEAK